MSKHPPLCPKTKVDFMIFAHSGAVDALISDDTYLDDDFPDHRQFIARYQACAWYDRHVRWSRIYNRSVWGHRYGSAMRNQISAAMARSCLAISQAWREWENLP